jgi:uncharacterized delta-60 repeat protein
LSSLAPARLALDAGFGGGGRITTSFGHEVDEAYAAVRAADGRLVVAGLATVPYAGPLEPGQPPPPGTRGVGVARYLADGSLDRTFGDGGKVTVLLGGDSRAQAVAVQADGKVVLAGWACGPTIAGSCDFAVARLDASGSLDPGFGAGGVALVDFGGSYERAYAMALLPGGRVAVAGYSDRDFALARLDASGALDPSFGTGGRVRTDFRGGDDAAYALVALPDGALVAAGSSFGPSGFDFALARYTAGGALDTTFGEGGRVITDFAGDWDTASALALDARGRLVAGGAVTISGNVDFGLARYTPDGRPDPTFGNGGKLTVDFGATERLDALAVLPGGTLAAAGATNAADEGDFALALVSPEGYVARLTTDFASGLDEAHALVPLPGGDLLAAGSATVGGRRVFAVARYRLQARGTRGAP